MATALEDLRILQTAEAIADAVWKQVVQWDEFARDVVGKQLTKAADSIGANIAEAFGRFNYGEKIQFLYYSRGSLFETKYWLNRALARSLMSAAEAAGYASRLTDVARQLNSFTYNIKGQRHDNARSSKTVHEESVEYSADSSLAVPISLFSDDDLAWLELLPTEAALANL